MATISLNVGKCVTLHSLAPITHCGAKILMTCWHIYVPVLQIDNVNSNLPSPIYKKNYPLLYVQILAMAKSQDLFDHRHSETSAPSIMSCH